jgi:hypothetical protein
MRALPRRLAWLSGLAVLLAVIAGAAEPVPSGLEPWRGWVLRGQEFRTCPLIAGHRAAAAEDFLCAWPGMLELSADDHGADVVQRWRVEVESWIPLPGDVAYWPQQVSVDGQPAPVVDRAGPSIRVAAGAHAIRAHIPWTERPQTLHVPDTIGLVALSVDSKAVVPVQRDGDALTLGRAKTAAPEADSLDVHVFRKLADDIPATLATVIQLNVSGQAREITIGPALPDGFAPLALSSRTWPAKLDADGRLRVLVQPGNDMITLDARATEPLAKIVARVPPLPWPQQEIWSYEAAPALRVTSAASALQVDPRQAAVPDDWNSLPAFALGDAAVLTIEERTRGLAPDEKNRLTLDREMWLDFSGDGWFARDRVAGEMLRGWRFDVAPPLTLERADALNLRVAGRNGESLLVTRGTESGSTGVEWRTPAVDLGAGVRIAEASAVLPVTGWQDSFDRVTTTLHLPNGYKLLGAVGADSAGGSWISGWTLLDVFVAAIVALLAWRLFGFVGVAIAIGYLVLAYQESGAPVWTLLAAFALGLVARALPAGRLATAAIWTRRAALALLVLVALPFVAGELRYALHPQLENGAFAFETGAGGNFVGELQKAAQTDREMKQEAPASAAAPPPPAESPRAADEAVAKDKLETVTVTASNIRRLDVISHYNESTVVQTGAGEPGWNIGSRYVLSWGGPVLPAQSVRLVIAPPWLVRVLRIALVALLAALIVRLVRGEISIPPRGAAAALGGAIVVAALSISAPARAQTFPPDELLNQLRSHLTETPDCVPGCAAIARAEVSARGDEIRVALEAHAAERVALPVPGDSDALALRSVTIDGVAQDGIARSKGLLHVALTRGVHRIELVYAVAGDKVALRFPMRPMRAEFSGDGWQASGISENRLLTESLSLARMRDNADTATLTGTQQFAPFVRVAREITLGLDWSISTQVHRLAPKEGGFTVSVPALAGEHVSTGGIKNEGGRIIAAIADGEDGAGWTSTLDKSETLTLTAPALTDRAEVWTLTASPIWHVDASGVPVAADTGADKSDFRRFEFHPLPGETLTLRIGKPEPAEGATRAIDRASLVVSAGRRASDAVLDLSLRASQGGEQAITLPADAEVMNVSRNGEVLNLRPRDGKLSLPLVPGSQQFEIRFREPTPVGFVTRTPAVALGLPAANLSLGIDLPADRWLLATGGPSEGPAVLYWSELLVMLLIAWALARTRRTRLTFVQWILLGIGFSTFSWPALLLVVAWLFALDWRERSAPPASAALFNLAQIGLAVLTGAALLCLVAAIPQGLLGVPDMQVAGNGSSAYGLRWFADRSADALPGASAISVPIWAYKIAMLAWAIWLANAVVGWLRHGFAAWTRGGHWRALPRKAVVDIPSATPPPNRAP